MVEPTAETSADLKVFLTAARMGDWLVAARVEKLVVKKAAKKAEH
jgi:hypothetical protein